MILLSRHALQCANALRFAKENTDSCFVQGSVYILLNLYFLFPFLCFQIRHSLQPFRFSGRRKAGVFSVMKILRNGYVPFSGGSFRFAGNCDTLLAGGII